MKSSIKIDNRFLKRTSSYSVRYTIDYRLYYIITSIKDKGNTSLNTHKAFNVSSIYFTSHFNINILKFCGKETINIKSSSSTLALVFRRQTHEHH